MIRRPVLVFVALLLAAPAAAVADTNAEHRARLELQKKIKEVWASKNLVRGRTAVYVVDARTGDELYKVRVDDKLNVASNVKLLSTATVLDTLGEDWVFKTRALGAAPDLDGVSKGDVYLFGMSDPTLSVTRLKEMALDLRLAGVDTIKGDVVLSSNVYRDTLGFPHVQVSVRGASRAGKTPSVSIKPNSDFVKIENKAKTTGRRRARLNIKTKLITDEETKEPRLVVTVSGTIKRNASHEVRRGVHKRSTFTGFTFRQMLIESGIEVEGRVRIEEFDQFVAGAAEAGYLPIELASTSSKPIGALVTKVNKRSLNYLSDRLVMSAGAYVEGGNPTMAKAVDVMNAWLRNAGINPNKVVVDTGSGLSYATQISTRQIVRILRTQLGYVAHKSGVVCANHACYSGSLSIGGVDGTLRKRFRGSDVQGKVRGKTGTLTGVIALSGIVSQSQGNQLAFSIVTNGNAHGNRRNVRKEHEKMVKAMYEYLEARAAIRADGASHDGHAVPAHNGADQDDADEDDIADQDGPETGGEAKEADESSTKPAPKTESPKTESPKTESPKADAPPPAQ